MFLEYNFDRTTELARRRRVGGCVNTDRVAISVGKLGICKPVVFCQPCCRPRGLWRHAGRIDGFRRVPRQSAGPRASRAGSGLNASSRQRHGPRRAAPLEFVHGLATLWHHALAAHADGAPSGDDAFRPFPAIVTITPSTPIRRTRSFPRSATYRFPKSSSASPYGRASWAPTAGPPSPLNPAIPVPAIVVTVPPSPTLRTR